MAKLILFNFSPLFFVCLLLKLNLLDLLMLEVT